MNSINPMNPLADVLAEAKRINQEIIDANAIRVANQNLQDEIMKCNTSKQIAEKLYLATINFQDNLPNGYDVGLQLVQFGTFILVLVENISYINHSLVVFEGTDSSSGNPVRLIQNVSQVNFLLMAVKNPEPETPKRKIGFETTF